MGDIAQIRTGNTNHKVGAPLEFGYFATDFLEVVKRRCQARSVKLGLQHVGHFQVHNACRMTIGDVKKWSNM